MGFKPNGSITTTGQGKSEVPSVSTAMSGSVDSKTVSSNSNGQSAIYGNLIFIDFETYWNTKEKYTLSNKKCSTLEYIKDSRFKVHGLAMTVPGKQPIWFGAHDAPKLINTLDWPKFTVVSHNAKFDGGILELYYGVRPKSYIDTLSMSRAVLGYTIKDHHLRTIAEYFNLVPKGEMHTDGVRDLTPAQEAELGEYCKHDNELAEQIFNLLAARFPASQYFSMDHTIKCFVRPMLVLDEKVLRECNETEKARRAKIFEEVGLPKSVFSSNDQFAKLLAERGFEVPLKPSPKVTGKMIPAFAVGDEGFRDMLDSGNEELEGLCIARMAAKSTLLETRSARLMRLATLGPWPFDIQYSGAQQTHRYSGGSGAGGNPQNFKQGSALRKGVCAPEGYKLGVADFAAVEARITAFIAQEPALTGIFLRDGDPYCDFATRHYKRQITKADLKERKFGKECILGLGYGMGWKKFKLRVRIVTGILLTDAEAMEVVDLYRETYYGIKQYWRTLDGIIPTLFEKGSMPMPNAPFLRVANGEIILPSGLPIRYPDLRVEGEDWVYDTYQGKTRQKHAVKLYGGKILENVCQALAGELTKNAIETAAKLDIWTTGQNHDEMLFLDLKSPSAPRCELVERAMVEAAPWWRGIKLKAEVGSGPNWLEAKR